jgi:hypothetical protein
VITGCRSAYGDRRQCRRGCAAGRGSAGCARLGVCNDGALVIQHLPLLGRVLPERRPAGDAELRIHPIRSQSPSLASSDTHPQQLPDRWLERIRAAPAWRPPVRRRLINGQRVIHRLAGNTQTSRYRPSTQILAHIQASNLGPIFHSDHPSQGTPKWQHLQLATLAQFSASIDNRFQS